MIFLHHYSTNKIEKTDPLAHVTDREGVYAVMVHGGRVGIVSQLNKLFEDIKLLEPSVLSATPR
jgi:hypothetical protein